MLTRFLITLAATAMLLAPGAASANLLWDVVPDDGSTVTDGGGTWISGGTTWNDGSGNVPWDNNAPAVAEFGAGSSDSGDLIVTVGAFMDATPVKALGIISRKLYTFNANDLSPVGASTIELNGTTPEVSAYTTTKFYANITTASGVQSVTFRTPDQDASVSKYIYLYGANQFNAPLVIGTPTDVATGVLFMPHDFDTTNGDPAGAGALGGSASAGITVLDGSTLSFREGFFTLDKPITIAGTGSGGRGALQFYTVTRGVSCQRELRGALTLSADARIEMREYTGYDPHSNIISGPISGDYVFTIRNSASNAPGRISLTNSANTTKGLYVFGDGGSDAPCLVTLGGTYTATESVTVAADSTIIVGGANYLVTPLVNLTSASAVLDASAAGLTLGNGTTLNTTLRGIGTVTGNVTAAAGSAIGAGTAAGTLAVSGTLDMSSGADGYWGLGALADNGTGVAGTDFALMTVSGDMTLGVDSQLTLDFAEGFAPNASEVFWQSDHAWTIVDVADGSLLTGSFASITNPTEGGAGTFTTSIVDNNILLSFEASPFLPPIPGDANNSGTVDGDDATVLAQNWGANGESIGWAQGDFNGDKAVNAADASILAANWGATRPTEGAGAVPEPGSLLLLAAGAASWMLRRRR